MLTSAEAAFAEDPENTRSAVNVDVGKENNAGTGEWVDVTSGSVLDATDSAEENSLIKLRPLKVIVPRILLF